MASSNKPQRRSLREGLRAILRRSRDDGDPLTLGSGILKRRDPSLMLLPTPSAVSLLPDFESSRFDIDQYSVSIPDHFQSTSVLYQPSNHDSVYSLLPRTSISQIDFQRSLQDQSQLHQLAAACSIPSIYRYGVSRQASVTTIRSAHRSTSTLKLSRSTQTLHENGQVHSTSKQLLQAPERVPNITPSLSPKEYRRPRRKPSSIRSNSTGQTRSSGRAQGQSTVSEVEAGLFAVDHFNSFCVLDTFASGCPVTATSADLRYVFDIGEEFCLNSTGIMDAAMDTVTGHDTEGNAITHLVLYSPLINPSSGRSRFVLASLIDVTSFIRDAASLPDLERISEESSIDEVVTTPTKMPAWNERTYELSSADLLGGCCLPEKPRYLTPTQLDLDDVWLDLASEESKRFQSPRTNSGATTPKTATSSSAPSIDDLLDQFVLGLQELYSDFFLLGKSPLDEDFYEICNVSPRVHASKEYIEGHLTKTPRRDLARLEQQLTMESSFQMEVRWGSKGEQKQLYCIPLFGRRSVTWACFLVETNKWQGLPTWREGRQQH